MIVHLSEFTSPKNKLVRILMLPLLLIKPMDLAGSSYVMLFFRKYTCFPLSCNDLATIRLDVIKRIENIYTIYFSEQVFIDHSADFRRTGFNLQCASGCTPAVLLVHTSPTHLGSLFIPFPLPSNLLLHSLSQAYLSLKAEAL